MRAGIKVNEGGVVFGGHHCALDFLLERAVL
jgi:hypothetical protein